MTTSSDIRVAAAGRSDTGRRRADNQDRFLILGLDGDAPVRVGSEGASPPEGAVEMDAEPGLALLVADGMGGHRGGARASQIVVDIVTRELTADAHGAADGDAFAARLRSSLCEANRAIHAEAANDDELTGMGTTATLAGVLGASIYVAQVGDSRAYLVRGEEVLRLTRDQSLVQDMIDSGILDESEASSVPNNMLLQALGVRSKVRPAVTFHSLRNDDVVLLCSDGLTQLLADDEIVETIRGNPDLGGLCDALVAAANERGGPDNVTAVAARCSITGPDADTAAEPLSLRRWERQRSVS